SRPNHEIANVIRVKPKLGVVLAVDHGKGIRELDAGLVVTVKGAEVVAKEQQVGNIEVRLTGDTGKAVVAARPLQQRVIDMSIGKLRGPCAYQRLVAQRAIASAAGRADAAAIQRLAYQHVEVSAILDRVAH